MGKEGHLKKKEYPKQRLGTDRDVERENGWQVSVPGGCVLLYFSVFLSVICRFCLVLGRGKRDVG